SGWYKTDYPTKSSDTDKSAKSSSDCDKPAAKTEGPAKNDKSDTSSSDKAATADKPAADKPAATSTSPGKPEKTEPGRAASARSTRRPSGIRACCRCRDGRRRFRRRRSGAS